MQTRLFIGAMSGTSADGVDAALVRITGTGLDMHAELVHFVESPYPVDLRQHILRTRESGETTLSDLASLGRDVSLAYVNVVRRLLDEAKVNAKDVTALAAHGQTLFHAPPLSIQWMDPALVAQETGIDVISDFRRADLAVGGQGAPLVPFADWILFRSESENRVILNIGGIANVTILSKGCTIDQVIGFDTGPGNCVSDWLMREHGGVDVGGKLASSGAANVNRLHRLMLAEYFHAPYPKSTDGPAMLDLWRRSANPDIAPEALSDELATAAAWVGWSIHHGISAALPGEPHQLIIAGGGARNAAIMQTLARQYPDRPIMLTDSLGLPAQAREAVAFAILGCATVDRVGANVTRVTGASRPVVLGAVYPA